MEIFEDDELRYFYTENLAEYDDNLSMTWLKGFQKNLYGRAINSKVKGSDADETLKG